MGFFGLLVFWGVFLGLLGGSFFSSLDAGRRVNDKEQLANSLINIDAYGGEAGK